MTNQGTIPPSSLQGISAFAGLGSLKSTGEGLLTGMCGLLCPMPTPERPYTAGMRTSVCLVQSGPVRMAQQAKVLATWPNHPKEPL